MAQQQVQNRFTLFFTLATSLFFLVILLLQGAPLMIALAATAVMGLMTAGLSRVSYAYQAFLQRRSFSGKKQADQSIESHQQRMVEIDMPMDEAFNLVMDALKSLDNQRVPIPDDVFVKLEMWLPRKQTLTIRESDQEQGIICAGLKASILGIPEFHDFSRITIRLDQLDTHMTQIHIESKPNIAFDIYDLGKNLHYVNMIALYLRRESQQLSAESRLQDGEIWFHQDVDETSQDNDVNQADSD